MFNSRNPTFDSEGQQVEATDAAILLARDPRVDVNEYSDGALPAAHLFMSVSHSVGLYRDSDDGVFARVFRTFAALVQRPDFNPNLPLLRLDDLSPQSPLRQIVSSVGHAYARGLTALDMVMLVFQVH